MLWLRLTWWWNYERPLRDVRIKWAQDGSESMSDAAFGQWINRLTMREFIALMFQCAGRK